MSAILVSINSDLSIKTKAMAVKPWLYYYLKILNTNLGFFGME